MNSSPLVAKALVQLARKRHLLDRAQCARLQVLLEAHGVGSLTAARQFVTSSGLLPPLVARKLSEHLPAPDQVPFGDYLPLAHLADGGMGSVWLAASPDHSLVVVKTMRGNLAGNPEIRQRFEREMRLQLELKHPHIIRCMDSGAASDGTLFLVLEYVYSGDLKDLVEAEGRLPEALATAVVYQVADALDGAHQRHTIHRDIKPANIFVSADGHAKLADFGIARSTAEMRTMLTMQGAIVGSPAYMAPEQVMGDSSLDIRCDLYALGAVLYYCLAGIEPYRGRMPDVLNAHRTAPVPEIRTVRPEVHPRVSEVIARCMQKSRDQRFKDPSELRTALAEAMAHLDGGLPAAQAAPVQPTTDHLAQTISTDLMAEAATQAVNATVATRAAIGGGVGTTIKTNESERNSLATMIQDWSGPPPLKASDLDATIAMDLSRPASEPKLEGDLTTASDAPWLTLTGGGNEILLFAKRDLLFGKMVEPPVDVCLRMYPVTTYRDACLKVSRQHLRLSVDGSRMVIGDLGSGNGTMLDGAALPANKPVGVDPGRDYALKVAGVLTMRLRAEPRSGPAQRALANAPTSDGRGACGLDSEAPVDAVTLRRNENRPGLMFAQVLRRLSLGGEKAMLPLPGVNGTVVEVALYNNRWLWRDATANGHWRPLRVGDRLPLPGVELTVATGTYEVFQG